MRTTQSDPALSALLELVPALNSAQVRWAVAGHVALRVFCAEAPVESGVDLVVDNRDRHVLRLLRDAGFRPAHCMSSLAIAHVDRADPNKSIRVHFPSTPPLTSAFDSAEVCEVNGVVVPVVDLVTLTLANLLSQRTGAALAARVGIAAGVSAAVLAERLALLDSLPPTKSPYVRLRFDRTLARDRLVFGIPS